MAHDNDESCTSSSSTAESDKGTEDSTDSDREIQPTVTRDEGSSHERASPKSDKVMDEEDYFQLDGLIHKVWSS